jgi:hypothetical protein
VVREDFFFDKATRLVAEKFMFFLKDGASEHGSPAGFEGWSGY